MDSAAELALSVRRFLDKLDLRTKLSTAAKLYLEFADVGGMHQAFLAIATEARRSNYRYAAAGNFFRYIDDHTIVFDAFAGVEIVLTCVQRFEVKAGGSVGYRDILFIDKPSE